MSFINSEDFISSLILLVLGAVVTVFLVPYFTNRWQIHQKGLEIRIDLAGRISRTVMGMIILLESKVVTKLFEESKKEEESKNEYRKFRVDGAVIWSELESYFPNEESNFPNKETGKDWQKLLAEIDSFYNNYVVTKPSGAIGEEKFKDWKTKILHKKFVIMQRLINRPMSRFSLLPGFVTHSRFYRTMKKKRLAHAWDEELSDVVFS